MKFIDRIEELEVLEKDWKKNKNAFIVVAGRRRIGKTTLIEKFLSDKEGIKYTAEDSSKKIQISQFKNILGEHFNDEFLIKQEISEWGVLFSYLERIIDKEKRIFIWIDEFSYIIKNDASATSAIQKFIDNFVRDSKLFFIVSGSLFGLLSEKVLSSSSPLYGRRTRDFVIKPIPSEYSLEFIEMKFEDKLKCLMALSGIPEYLNIAAKYNDFNEFSKSEFFRKEGYFYREPIYLLSQEFKEIKIYFSILNAISLGNTKPSEIANFVGIKAREIYPYLELLINYGFVKREENFFSNIKKGIYKIDDNFFDFWFNFVDKNRTLIESGNYIGQKDQLNKFFGKRFEIFVRDNFSKFFKNFNKISNYWNKENEVDLVALNNEDNILILGECKWEDDVSSFGELKKLNNKKISLNIDSRKAMVQYAIFAKSFSKKTEEFEGKKVYCFDLKDIEKLFKKRIIVKDQNF